MRGVPASWALALLVCCVPSSQGEARLDLFSAPQGTCQRCTCIDCACAIEFPECRKCQDSQRVAQLVVDEADGLCRRARVRHLHPHVDKQVLAPLTFMAVVCARGLWLGADAATKDECDRKAASLAASFERGERDANTQRCLPGGGGYMRYACGDDDEAVAAATSAADATQPLSALPGLEEASSQALRSRVQVCERWCSSSPAPPPQ